MLHGFTAQIFISPEHVVLNKLVRSHQSSIPPRAVSSLQQNMKNRQCHQHKQSEEKCSEQTQLSQPVFLEEVFLFIVTTDRIDMRCCFTVMLVFCTLFKFFLLEHTLFELLILKFVSAIFYFSGHASLKMYAWSQIVADKNQCFLGAIFFLKIKKNVAHLYKKNTNLQENVSVAKISGDVTE